MHTAAKPRDIRLDILRGFFILMMATVHVPSPLSHWFQEPLGFTSDAEGFVFLGACLAGYVYGKTYLSSGWSGMARRVWGRARTIYFVHLAILVPTVLLAWALAAYLPPLANHFHDFLAHPWGSLALLPLLLHQPPLFDILPMYVILLGATPLLLAAGRRFGWPRVVLLSALGWLVVQFKMDIRLWGDSSRLPYVRLASFNLLAWQFLWICGLALGETATRRSLAKLPGLPVLAVIATPVVLFGLLVQHGFWPEAWFNPDLYIYMAKWRLGPLRVLNFAAWVVLLLAWNPSIPTRFFSPMALLGRHSLAVFAFHLPLVIIAATVLQMYSLSTPAMTLIGLSVIAALFPWAAWLEARGRRTVPVRALPAAETAVATNQPASPALPEMPLAR